MSPGLSTRLLATQSDERLVALARGGHERAFEALVHRYRRPLLRYCRRLPIAEGRVEDVLQQALLQAWVALRRGTAVREFRPWLYWIVHNVATNAARDTARARARLGESAELDAEDSLARSEPDFDEGLRVREALAGMAALPPLQREVMVRTAVGGYSHEEVASDLGITHGAVRGLLYRARATLRTAVTAITPSSLIVWLAGQAGLGSPSFERAGELASAGGGAAGLGGLLVKGGVAAVTAGTLITGIVATSHDGVRHPSSRQIAAAAPSPAPSVQRTLGNGSASGSRGQAPAADVPSAPRRSASQLHGARTPRSRGGVAHKTPRHSALLVRGPQRPGATSSPVTAPMNNAPAPATAPPSSSPTVSVSTPVPPRAPSTTVSASSPGSHSSPASVPRPSPLAVRVRASSLPALSSANGGGSEPYARDARTGRASTSRDGVRAVRGDHLRPRAEADNGGPSRGLLGNAEVHRADGRAGPGLAASSARASASSGLAGSSRGADAHGRAVSSRGAVANAGAVSSRGAVANAGAVSSRGAVANVGPVASTVGAGARSSVTGGGPKRSSLGTPRPPRSNPVPPTRAVEAPRAAVGSCPRPRTAQTSPAYQPPVQEPREKISPAGVTFHRWASS